MNRSFATVVAVVAFTFVGSVLFTRVGAQEVAPNNDLPADIPLETVAPLPEPTTQAVPTWPTLTKIIGLEGVEKKGVYTITIPRDDLFVSSPDVGGDIPAGAGLETQLHFFMCPCGKTNVIGTFILAEYEANDVADELRKVNMHVVNIGPAFYNETPRVVMLRFQGEGFAEPIAGAIKEALGRTGEARNPKIELPR